MRKLFILLVVCSFSTSVYAQNPCTDPAPEGVILDPGKLFVSLPEHTAKDAAGNPVVTEYQAGYFLQSSGVSGTPVQGPSTVALSSFTLVSGTTDCYQATLPMPIPVQGQTEALVAAIKARNSVQSLESGWSAVSNPFGTRRTVLQTPGRPIVRQ